MMLSHSFFEDRLHPVKTQHKKHKIGGSSTSPSSFNLCRASRASNPSSGFWLRLASCCYGGLILKQLRLPLAVLALTASSEALMQKKTALVTGATDGIGLTTAKHLAKKGFYVIVHGRDEARIQDACVAIKNFANAPSVDAIAMPVMADLSTRVGCQTLASEVSGKCTKLDLLINNAGVFTGYKKDVVVWDEDGRNQLKLERTFAVNVAAPFLVTSFLLPLLTIGDGTRIIITSSISQCSTITSDQLDDVNFERRTYSNHRAYSESKLMDAMLTMEFSRRLQNAGIPPRRVTCNTLDPGTVNTKMLLAGWGPCGINVRDALDETWLATSKDVEGESGKYYVGRWETRAGQSAYSEEQCSKLWGVLQELSPEAAAKWEDL